MRDRSDSLLGAIFNFLNSTIGSAYIYLSNIMSMCGLLVGIPLIIIVGLYTLVSIIYLYNGTIFKF